MDDSPELLALSEVPSRTTQEQVWEMAIGLASRIACQSLAPHYDRENVAADLALKAFLLEGEGRLPSHEGERRAYLTTMTRNQIIDEYRKTSRRKTFVAGLGGTSDGSYGIPEQYSNLGTADQAEHASSNAFDTILSQAPLSDDQRVVLQLTHVHDLTSPTIAKLLDIPERTVRTRIHRAYKVLKNHYPNTSALQDLIQP